VAFAFKAKRSIERNARRILRSEIGRSIGCLQREEEIDPSEAIHQARRRIKRARALLGLIGPGMRKSERAKISERLRQANREMAPMRDAHVTRAAWESLVAHRGTANHSEVEKRMHAVLLRRERDADLFAEGKLAVLSQVIEGLEEAYAAADKLTLRSMSWTRLTHQLRKSFRRGRDAWVCACVDDSAESLHSWRKAIGVLRDQLTLFRCARPKIIDSFTGALHQVADVLGNDHDLAVLREIVVGDSLSSADDADVRSLLDDIDEHRASACAQALCRGVRLYRIRAKTLACWVERSWARWRAS
jgi:CHAD domain-containing protein